jgi:RNA polymerase sigma-70 factor (ECF subfamily)
MGTNRRIPALSGTESGVPTLGPSDETLMQSIADRDSHAMHVLFVRYSVQVYRFTLRLCRDASLAEDLVGEVFLDVWRQAGAFEGRCRVSTWLLAIARNKTYSTLRRHAPTQLDDDLAASIADTGENPESIVNRYSQNAAIGRCLAQLSTVDREIIDLVYYHEKSVKEVAGIVGVPEGTVKTRMFHARRRAAELLKEAGLHELRAL